MENSQPLPETGAIPPCRLRSNCHQRVICKTMTHSSLNRKARNAGLAPMLKLPGQKFPISQMRKLTESSL